MLIGLHIILKILIYCTIIFFVRFVFLRLQKPAKELKNIELGERYIDWRVFSIIYLIVAICFVVILCVISSLPSNLEGKSKMIMISTFILLICFFCIVSFLYGRVYVKIENEQIRWRKMFGEEKSIRYEEITQFSLDGNGNLRLFRGDKCVLQFWTATNQVFIRERLRNKKVANKVSANENMIIMRMGKGYVAFDAVCIVIFMALFILSVCTVMVPGVLLFFVCIIGSIISFFSRKSRTIRVHNRSIFEKKLFSKEKKITFSEVAYLSILPGNNTEIICIHSSNGVKIKVPKYFQNVEKFEMVITKQRWKWK